MVNSVPEHYVLARDPKDSKYINLAVAANAQFLVTDDKDLLELMETSSPAGSDFRDRFPSLQIVTAAYFENVMSRSAG